MSRRPNPGPPFREGTHWETREAKGWTVYPNAVGQCHESISAGMRCLRPARVTTGRFSFWCERHMDGRWIEQGHVMEWYLVEDCVA